MKDDRLLYYIYLGLWGNQEYSIQCEQIPLTYLEFSAIADKSKFIDELKQAISATGV